MTDTPFRGEDSLDAWLDRHHVDVIRTQAVNLDGVAAGKHVHRRNFVASLPYGHRIDDIALAVDLQGSPHASFWPEFRQGIVSDVCLRPDLSTLTPDGHDPNLGHCIADYACVDGSDISLCPRSTLRRTVQQLEHLELASPATFTLEFYLFQGSFTEARENTYKRMIPLSAATPNTTYSTRNSYRAVDFMEEATHRLELVGITWDEWSNKAGTGQFELRFPPADPVTIADRIVRAKQVIYEVAVDLDLAATFMPIPGISHGSKMYIHHTLEKNHQSERPTHTDLFSHWLGGLVRTLPAAVSYLRPGVNAYRPAIDLYGTPLNASWGEENKSAALRLTKDNNGAQWVEHRIGSSDLNPYLALAAVLAGGIAGIKNQLEPPEEIPVLSSEAPEEGLLLPDSINLATDKIEQDELISDILGQDVVDYWIKTRRLEWLNFHNAHDTNSDQVTEWEYQRYFEII